VTDLQRETERSSYEQDDQLALEAADTITRLTAEVDRLLALTRTEAQYTLKLEAEITTLRADNKRLRAAIECALRQLADGNRVLATGTLAAALSGDKHE
jgi:hypothetical protein